MTLVPVLGTATIVTITGTDTAGTAIWVHLSMVQPWLRASTRFFEDGRPREERKAWMEYVEGQSRPHHRTTGNFLSYL